jgi:small subunit ribosomal protein S1
MDTVFDYGASANQDNMTEQSPGGHPMEAWLEADYGHKSFDRGDVVDGVIVHVSPGEILVDIGAKTEAFVAEREVQSMTPADLANLQVGDHIRAVVLSPEDREGNLVLSLAQAELDSDWGRAEELYASGEVFEGTVTNHNKGGVIVPLGKVRGFVPASQLSRGRRKNAGQGGSLAGLVGENLWLKVIEVDRTQNRLILSELAAMRQRNKAERERLLSELKEGDVVEGEVISLADFGAFVSLGGADGLIHLSELAWHRVNHPSEVLKVGDEVECVVLNVDRERRRIGLSLKRLQPEPWSQVEDKYQVGQLVDVTITKLASFGAFARVDSDVEGLIHVSELDDRPVGHPKEVVKEGDVVTVQIIRIDSERKRIGLSLRRAKEALAGAMPADLGEEDPAEVPEEYEE